MQNNDNNGFESFEGFDTTETTINTGKDLFEEVDDSKPDYDESIKVNDLKVGTYDIQFKALRHNVLEAGTEKMAPGTEVISLDYKILGEGEFSGKLVQKTFWFHRQETEKAKITIGVLKGILRKLGVNSAGKIEEIIFSFETTLSGKQGKVIIEPKGEYKKDSYKLV